MERDDAHAERDRAVADMETLRAVAEEATGAGIDVTGRGRVRKVRISGHDTGIMMRGPESDISEADIAGPKAQERKPPTAEELAATEEAEAEAARRRREEADHGPFKYGPTHGPQSVRDQAGSRWDPDAEDEEEHSEEPCP